MNIPFGKPVIGDEELAAVERVLKTGILVHGPEAEFFEKKFSQFTESPFSVSVSSCTAGMHLFYVASGIGVGDEVICPAQTHVATAHAAELAGATAVFVDVDPLTGNLCPEKLERALTAKTKAIAVVHYLGVPSDMDEIIKIAAKHDLKILEDCALALGSKYKNVHTGLLGDAGCFSFYPVKHITSAEGGMLITKDSNLAAKIRHLRAFGVDRSHGERSIPGLYDVNDLGFNYRMSEIHAAIGAAQLEKLPSFLKKRKSNFQYLSDLLVNADCKGLRIVPQINNDVKQSSHYCLSVILDAQLALDRASIIRELNADGVGTSIYYPHPVPRLSFYANKYRNRDLDLDRLVATIFSDQSIALPVGPHLDLGEMEVIASSLIRAIKKRNLGSL